jgi:hypothetical protein
MIKGTEWGETAVLCCFRSRAYRWHFEIRDLRVVHYFMWRRWRFQHHAKARYAIAEHIEVFYNR